MTALPRRPAGIAWRRLPLLLPGLLALVAGVAAGLWRLGAWPGGSGSGVPALAHAAAGHGALMVCGFFGLVIALERAAALAVDGQRQAWAHAWAWAAPLAAGAGTALLLAGQLQAAAWAWLGSAGLLLAATLLIWRRQPEPFVGVLALGAAAAVGSHALVLAGAGLHVVLPWWLAFLVFTIAGERLELSRLAPRAAGAGTTFAAITGLLVMALGATLLPGPWVVWAGHGFGAGLLALAAWLLRHDVARRTVRQRGLVRFIACSLLAGHAWLGGGGALMAVHGLHPGTPGWDAALHAVLLGFVFSMVFGHAPIVLPAVLRVQLPYHPRFYVPLLLLHLSVAGRVAGSLAGLPGLRQAAAWGSALALVVFIATMLAAARSRRVPVSGRFLEPVQGQPRRAP